MSRVSFEDNGPASPQTVYTSQHEGSQNGYFSAEDCEDGRAASPPRERRRASLSIRIPPTHAAMGVAFTALQYLPMPVLVLSSAKTVVLANEAMGRLLGIDISHEHDESDAEADTLSRRTSLDVKSLSDTLQGVTLTQLGFDLMQNGSPVFVAWEDFLGTLVDDASKAQCSTSQLNTHHVRQFEAKETTPTNNPHQRSLSRASSTLSRDNGSRTEVHDCATEVLFSTQRDNRTGLPLVSKHGTYIIVPRVASLQHIPFNWWHETTIGLHNHLISANALEMVQGTLFALLLCRSTKHSHISNSSNIL